VASTTDVRSLRTHIGKAMQFKGEISGGEDVFIDGKVEGIITLAGQSVTVGPNGDVRANVNIREITIQGRLEGSVVAKERVEIAPTGAVSGEVTTARIAVHDGAFFKGKIDVVKSKEESRTAAQEASTAPSPGSARGAAAAAGAAAASVSTNGQKADAETPHAEPAAEDGDPEAHAHPGATLVE